MVDVLSCSRATKWPELTGEMRRSSTLRGPSLATSELAEVLYVWRNPVL